MSNKPVYSGVKVFSEILSEKMTITGEYSLPTMDGTAGQVIMTDGAGNATFQTITGFLTPTSIVNGTGINWTQIGPVTVQGNVTLSPFSTTNLAEGVNLYYTNTRVNNQVASLLQPGLAGTGANSITWTYNSGLGTLTPTVSLAPFSTSNLVEGTRLYFTNERVDDRVAALLQTGTTGAGPASLTWSYNDPANTLTPIISLAPFTTDNLAEGSTNLYFTDERVDDRVSNLLINSSSITWTYNDVANTICADSTGVGSINVQRNGSLCGTQNTVNFKEGTGITMSVVNDIGNNRVNVEICSTGGVDNAVIVLGTGPGTSVRKNACNTASGYYVTTSGGCCNVASNNYSTIAGGSCNTVTSIHSTISGGYNNTILTNVVGGIAGSTYSGTATDGTYILPQDSTTGSGSGAIFKVTFVSNAVTSILVTNPGSGYSVLDTITILGASITGGTVGQNLVIIPNVSTGNYSTVGGGSCNTAGSACNGYSTISGGYGNVTDGDWSVIGGGSCNLTNGCASSILGGGNNFAQFGATVGGGYGNIASGSISSLLGGGSNTASGYISSIGGGSYNVATGCSSTISGGCNNTASADYSVIGGGYYNTASGNYMSTVSGGRANTASGDYSTIGGGSSNYANSDYASVLGGYCNCSCGPWSTIGGGHQNVSAGLGSTVGGGGWTDGIFVGNNEVYSTAGTISGGADNRICSGATNGTVSGGYCNILTNASNNSTISGGAYNTISEQHSTIGGGYCNTASGYYGCSTISGGRNNFATNQSVIGGGYCNVSCNLSAVGGGYCNTASWYYSTVGGGFNNTASFVNATVGGGFNNTASCNSTTIGGGYSNTASCNYATIGGGLCNVASNCYSTIGGGTLNTSSGRCSTLGGGFRNISCNSWSTVGGGFCNIAGGIGSTVSGGGYTNGEANQKNRAYAELSTIGGGGANTICASASSGTIGGGQFNFLTNTAYTSVISGGYSNTASGYSASILGGSSNTASGGYSSIVGGKSASATRYGERAYSIGFFTLNGDAQHVQLLAKNSTINGAIANLYVNGVSLRPTIAVGQVLSGTVNILGVSTSGSVIARYLRQFTISNIGGTTSLTGSVITLGTDEAGGTSIAITADDTNDALQIEVTGVIGSTIQWIAQIDGVQITI